MVLPHKQGNRTLDLSFVVLPLSTHTLQLPMAFYTYSLLYPIHAVCCSKLPKLPPNQCCIAFKGTEDTTRQCCMLFEAP